MYRAFLLVSLVLFGSFANHISAQATSNKNQSLANTRSQKDPVGAVLPSSSVSTERQAEANRFYMEGLKLADAEILPQAAESFLQALKLDSNFADAYSALGRTYFKMHEWQKAIDNLRRAAELRAKQREFPNSSTQLAKQAPDQSGTIQKGNVTASQGKLTQANNANTASAKTLQEAKPTPSATGNRSTGVVLKPPNTKPEFKGPGASISSDVTKTGQPQLKTNAKPDRPPETITTLKAPASGAVNNQPVNSSNTPAPNAQPERREEASAPPKSAANAPVNKQPITNTNADVLKTLKTQSQTTAGVAGTEINQPPATANAVSVKGSLPPAEAVAEPARPLNVLSSSKSEAGSATGQTQDAVGVRAAMNLTPSPKALENRSAVSTSATAPGDEPSLTKIYRIGPNDVLDVRLNESDSTRSTLYTVTPSGLLEYPMLNEPLPVAGLTAEEIGGKIEAELTKRALVENPKVMVGVRDYVSHAILVSGLVKESGTKFLRREAVPLYVVVADAQPAPEAARVTVVRNEQHQIYEIDLTQAADMDLLIRHGDVITLQPNVTQFIYIGGEVKNPGEKTFRRGLTLTQAILTAGGVSGKGRVAEIGRDDGRGFLVGTRFSLKDIGSGEAADPILKPSDRIMILR